MFSPLDILYIVLAFCALWLTAALFWLIYQVATMLRNVNETIAQAREKLEKIEMAITGMRNKFDKMTSLAGLIGEGLKALVSTALERRASKANAPEAPKSKKK